MMPWHFADLADLDEVVGGQRHHWDSPRRRNATAAPMNLSAALLSAVGSGPADCLAQASHGVDVLRVPEPDFFVLGMKSYGRNSTFLLRVGYDQVDDVASAYAKPRSEAHH